MTTHARHRFPADHKDTTALLVTLASVAGMVAVLAIVAAVTLWFRLNDQVERIDSLSSTNQAAAVSNYTSRRAGALESCQQREQLKTDLRAVLRRFQVDPSSLPHSADGRPALAPLAGGCAPYVDRTVPASSRP